MDKEVKFIINDARLITAFKNITFSGFKKKDVIAELTKEMIAGNIKHSCFWVAELVSSGLYREVWDTIMFVYGKFIGLKNPKLSIFIFAKINTFKDIINTSDNILLLRNNIIIRDLIAETICCICCSVKDDGFNTCIPSHQQLLQPPYEHNNSFHLRAEIYKDPPEIVFSLHELFCVLTISNNYNLTPLTLSSFWIEIIMKKGQHIKCTKRDTNVGYETHITWAVWDIIKLASIHKNDNILFKTICALEYIYKLKFKSPDTIFKERKYIMFTACSFILGPIDWTIPLFHPQIEESITIVINNNESNYKKVLEIYASNINQLFSKANITP